MLVEECCPECNSDKFRIDFDSPHLEQTCVDCKHIWLGEQFTTAGILLNPKYRHYAVDYLDKLSKTNIKINSEWLNKFVDKWVLLEEETESFKKGNAIFELSSLMIVGKEG